MPACLFIRSAPGTIAEPLLAAVQRAPSLTASSQGDPLTPRTPRTQGKGATAGDLGEHALSDGGKDSAVAPVAQRDRTRRGAVAAGWDRCQALCYVVCRAKWFSHLTTAVIVLNALMMALVW